MRSIGARASLVVLVLALVPVAALSQEPSPEAPAEAPPEAAEEAPPEAAQEETGEPEMAEAPLQFRLSGTVGYFAWEQEEGVVNIDNLVNLGIDIESRVVPAVAFRFRGSYGSTEAFNDTTSIGVNQWEFGVDIVGRLAVAPLTAAGVVPFGLIGAGAISLDPRTDPDNPAHDDLITRSQGAFSLGGGVDIEPGDGRWGGRVEFRHYRVSLENPFEPIDRTGDTIGGNFVMASIFWKL